MPWRLAARLARRDLHHSLRGLRLLLVCIFLGVATLATIGSLTSAITGEIEGRGQTLLGGDVQVAMTQREATAEEQAALGEAGEVSSTIRLRSMARPPQGGSGTPVLTELKAVDAAYPLFGTLLVDGRSAAPLDDDTIYVVPELADRLRLTTGDSITYGTADFRIAGLITEEPDRVGEGFTLGPVAIVSMDGLRRTGLVQPGSLFESKYRIRLPAGAAPDSVVDALRERFPSSSWEFDDRSNAAPGTSRFFDRLGQFMGLIALAALVIAGIGVGNGVTSYLRSKRNGIATLKALGATSGDIGRIYLIQIGALALTATAAGVLAGALLPNLVFAVARDLLPIAPGFAFHPVPLAASAAYGLLIAIIFTLPPLARARFRPVAGLFREEVGQRRSIDRTTLIRCAVAAALIVALALGTAERPLFSASVLAAIAGAFLLLAGLGWAVRRIAKAVPRPRRPLLRLALTGLYRPGAQTVPLVVALGLALTLFVTLAAIQTSISGEIERTVPRQAPNQFVLDLPSDRRAEFEAIVRREAPQADINVVPNLRGTILAFGGQRVADLAELPEGAWFLRGERGVTYSATVPEGSEVVAGEWWPANYRGPPLVSLDREAAAIMGVGLGDTLTVSVLGREIEARIGSLREIHWDSMGFNYILVFSPSALEAAPHSLAATITMDDGREAAVTRALLAVFPSISVIDVGEIVAEVSTVLDQMSTAIFLAASIAILAGIAVLIGALAASRQARSYDSVILKTLGATRLQVLATQALEHAILATVVAGVSLALGLGGAWFVVVQLFEFGWQPDWRVVLTALFAGAGLTFLIALLSSLPLLNVRPASALRQL